MTAVSDPSRREQDSDSSVRSVPERIKQKEKESENLPELDFFVFVMDFAPEDSGGRRGGRLRNKTIGQKTKHEQMQDDLIPSLTK